MTSVDNAYQQFLPKHDVAYHQACAQFASERYKVSSTPVFLAKEQYQRLSAITEATISLLQQPDYQSFISLQRLSFLPQFPLYDDDYFGCVDFHVRDNQEKIIEVNLFPPGQASFFEEIESTFLRFYGQIGESLGQGFFKKLVSVIGKERFNQRLAIVDSDVKEQFTYNEFLYCQKMFKKFGYTLDILSAETCLGSVDGKPAWIDSTYDSIYNRLIPSEWKEKKELFTGYSNAYSNSPERFFTNPNGWSLADKRLLPLLKQVEQDSFGLSPEVTAVIAPAVLSARITTSFESFEEFSALFGAGRRVVMKPLDSFGSKGILYKPSTKSVHEILDSGKEYIVQELWDPGVIPYQLADQSEVKAKFDLRMVFLTGKVVGAYARVYQGSITNSRTEVGGLAPVLLV